MPESILKPLSELTERTYLGVGYTHEFVNDATGETVYVPCTEEEYAFLGTAEGGNHRPTLEGHTWKQSLGGTYKVDTPNEMLGKDEYCIVGDRVCIRYDNPPIGKEFQSVSLDTLQASIEIP